jgi:ABC-2 type transport system permease protein
MKSKNHDSRFNSFMALLRRELSSYFQTPVAYVVGIVFLGIVSVRFFSVFFLFDRVEMRQFFASLPLLLALLMPALSMKLVAEERRRGTYELLATLPLNNREIILAKFFALWITGLFILLPTSVFVITVKSFGPLDFGPVAGGYLGTVLLLAVYGAAGLFSSAAARNETIALILGLVITLSLALLNSFLILMPTAIVPLVDFIGIGSHFSGFAQGVIDSRSLVYLLSLTVFFLVLAERQLTRDR